MCNVICTIYNHVTNHVKYYVQVISSPREGVIRGVPANHLASTEN